MKSITETNVTNKRVLLRCDFNVPFSEGKVKDDWRLKMAVPTIKLLKKQRARIILISHLKRTDTENQKSKDNSLKKIIGPLSKILGEKIVFGKDCVGRKIQRKVKKIKPGEIILLENLRFHQEEVNNSQDFAKELSLLADLYVNDAFSVCHRLHASVASLPKFLPSFSGLRLEKELTVLSKIKQSPKAPSLVIIGGEKLKTKLKVIKGLLKYFDHILLGGKLSEAILTVKGIMIGRPWPPEDVVSIIQKINLTNTKIHLPLDILASPEKTGEPYVRQTGPAGLRKEEMALDIGPETIAIFKKLIKGAGTVVLAGPLGFYQEKIFSQGTKEIARAIIESKAFSIAGGGDTLAALKEIGLRDRFSFLSTGGGAMLSFLSDERMPGLEALNLS